MLSGGVTKGLLGVAGIELKDCSISYNSKSTKYSTV
jgi:hypothetical protein